MSKPKVNVLIVDLDNTLYDWFHIWHASFLPIYEGLRDKIRVDVDELEKSIRDIHRKRRTSEYTFLVDELNFTTPDGTSLRHFLKTEIAQSKLERDRALRLYPTVLKTLWRLKKQNVRIIAYTESLSFYSGYRLKKLGLDGVIDYLYCPQDHDLPIGIDVKKIRSLPEEFYELQITEIRHTTLNDLKPNPRLLREIIDDIHAKPSECVYVGDSLFKDVAMAQDTGVHDVYAAYGVSQFLPGYDLLQKVSHWTDDDIEREKNTNARIVKPSTSIDFFGEILQRFDFVGSKDTMTEATITQMIDIWKKSVDVQQHFNQIEMQIRNYALTITGALMAAAGITFRDGLKATILGWDVSISSGIAIIALCVWSGFWFMDRHWYHRLLKAAVDHATKIEKKIEKSLPEIALSSAISISSPVEFICLKLSSSDKINLFYFIGAIIIFGFIVFAMMASPIPTPANHI